MATRTVTNSLRAPASDEPLAYRQVSVQLNAPAFTAGATVEVIRTSYATTGADGVWSIDLDVNADLTPTGTSYTVREAPGVIWTFVVPAGSGPVFLFDCLVDSPTNPNPIVGGGHPIPPGGSTGQVLSKASSADYDAQWAAAGGAAAVSSVAGRTGAVVLSSADLSDAASLATTTALSAESVSRVNGDAAALQKSANLSDLASASTARTSLGLGTAAVTASTAYDAAGAAAAAQSAAATDATSKASGAQAYAIQRGNHTGTQTASTISDFASATAAAAAVTANTAAISAETTRATTAEGLAVQKSANLSDLASASAARTNLGLGTAATTPSTAYDATGAAASAQAAAATDATTKANTAQAFAVQRANHSGTQTADTITDGTTNKAYTAVEKTKLAGITGSNTGDQSSVTGNSGTATKLATARNINGVAFDGTADVTIADSTKVPTTRQVAGHALSADVTLTKADVGLGNVDNTADVSKPVSTAQATANTAVQTFAVARANHTGTQSADTLTDGTTNRLLPDAARKYLDGSWTPANHGFITWAYDPALCSSNSGPSTAGTLQVVRVHIPYATTVTNIVMFVSVAGATLTSGQCLAGLYDSGLNLLASTTDQSATWVSTGLKVMALTAAQSVAAGDYFVMFFANGTTLPSFARCGVGGIVNANLAGNASRFGLSSTTRTTSMPNPAATISNPTTPFAFWAALS